MLNTMHTAARNRAKQFIDDDQPLKPLTKSLPERYSLEDLREEVASDLEGRSKEDQLGGLLILDTCLAAAAVRLTRDSEHDDEAISDLSIWISEAILPDGSIVTQDEVSKGDNSKALTLTHQLAILGLQALRTLTNLSITPPKTLPNPVLLTLIAFSSHATHTPWTTLSTCQISTSLLQNYTHQTSSGDFLSNYLLLKIIRPLFTASQPPTITTAGRVASPSSLPSKVTATEGSDRSRKPWKYEKPYSITVFRWVVENISKEVIQQTWHQFTPPLLTLLDDPSTPILVQGAEILSLFIPNMSSKLLAQSGLGELFEDALLPTLLYLPSLTPLSESLQLLPQAYSALMTLCDARFPPPSQMPSVPKNPSLTATRPEKEREKVEESKNQKLMMLDRIVRRGVFTGYVHVMEHASIVEILVTQLRVLVDKMGLHSVKYLKDVIPLLSTQLTNPFVPSRPSLLTASILCLQTIILNTWPRLLPEGKYRLEIIKVLCVCWQNLSLHEEAPRERVELGKAREEIKITGRMLVKAGKGAKVGIRKEVEELVVGVDEMGEVFGIEV